MKIKAILFDLDGTLLDTAPDFTTTINQLRARYQLPPLEAQSIRDKINLGARGLTQHALETPVDDALLAEFLDIYDQIKGQSCELFPGIKDCLENLIQQQHTWGIVTNKHERFTEPLITQFSPLEQSHCVVCGDTVGILKPDPASLLHASKLIGVNPEECVYIGDSEIDVIASRACGMQAIVALFGYIPEDIDATTWQADAYAKSAFELIDLIKKLGK